MLDNVTGVLKEVCMNLIKLNQALMFLMLVFQQHKQLIIQSFPLMKGTNTNDSLDTTFMSTIEDELAQSGFKVFKDKVLASNPKRTLSVVAK